MGVSTGYGNDKEQARRTVLMYVGSGSHDPTVDATEAPQGAIFLRTGPLGGSCYLKQDDGETTNWLLILVGPSGGGPAWQTAGNVVLGGVLGTLNAAGFDFVTASVSRGGFKSDGKFELRTPGGGSYPDSGHVTWTASGTVIGAGPHVLASFVSADPRAWMIRARGVFRSSLGTQHLCFERQNLAWREGGAFASDREHTTMTVRQGVGVTGSDLHWANAGPSMEVRFTGLPATTFHYALTVDIQGIGIP